MRGVKNLFLIKRVIELRRMGLSYDEIILKTGTSRSNLSSWLSNVSLSKKVEKNLLDKKRKHLFEARNKALIVLKHRRDNQETITELEVDKTLSKIDFDKNYNEALLAMLYLGEGFKMKSAIGLGNSNPDIMKLFVGLLRSVYDLDETKFRIYLHLRYDQDDILEKKFWSQTLSIPLNKFGKTQFDKRTQGSETWKDYHGVCSVYYYDAKIEKRLTIFQKSIINRVLKIGRKGG
ncbi:MAG: hypothetical protein WCV83_02960 [Candidatus Magasanikbacteria bacterium]|jgi:hypothetical protein